jgi:leader peptidase (prepilin peptidase)/N-methyltransferase
MAGATARVLWQALLAGMLAVVGAYAVGAHPFVLPVVYLAAVTPELIRVDLRERRLPNRLVLPALGLGLAAIVVEWVQTGVLPIAPLAAAGAYAGFLLVLALFGGMGMGDVKLGAALGLASWTPTVGVLSPVIAFLAGGVFSVVLLARRGRGGSIAFGPFLLAGFWIAVALEALGRLS